MVNEPQADYEKAEMDLLRVALKRTDTERFLMMTSLMKQNGAFKKNSMMKHKQNEYMGTQNVVNEPQAEYGFQTISEDDKLKLDMHRSDTEKFKLFTKMLRRNSIFNKAVTNFSSK